VDKAFVQELVRLRLKDKRLPEGRAVAIRETLGDGQQCDACDAPIVPSQKAVLAMVSLAPAYVEDLSNSGIET
jgi:hypothetical protein